MSDSKVWDAVIVGGGISGLAARREFVQAGIAVLTLEKSRGLGGRLCTRRWPDPAGDSLADLGAQFVSARGVSFSSLLELGNHSGVLKVQIPGLSQHDRYVHSGGMSALAKLTLETPLETERSPIQRQIRVKSVQQEESGLWILFSECGQEFHARSILLTAPLPQTLELLERSKFNDPDFFDRELTSLKLCRYLPCLAAIFPLACDSGLESPGILKKVSDKIEGIFDQKKKGISSLHDYLIVHASADWSKFLWDRSEAETLEEIWNETVKFLPNGKNRRMPAGSQLHKWRYCEPDHPIELPFFASSSRLSIAGDAFGGSRVEGAFESGRNAALAMRFSLGAIGSSRQATPPKGR